MSQGEIRITAEPVDNHRCKFVVSQPLHATGVRRFASADEAKGSPLAEAIFAIPAGGVTEVIVRATSSRSSRTIPRRGRRWGRRSAPRFARRPRRGPLRWPRRQPSPGAGAVNDDALYEQVAKVFDEQVNPMVARHGGRVELIDVQDAVVMLRMGGGCQGCGMADVTLRQASKACSRSSCPRSAGSSTSPITPRAPTPTSRPPKIVNGLER